MITTQYQALSLVMSVLCLTACVVLPTALPDPPPFDEDTLTSTLKPGITTRDEIRQKLQTWRYETDEGVQTVDLNPISLEKGRWWYVDLGRETLGFAGCVISYAGPVCFGKDPGNEIFYLVLEFDSSDKLIQWWITRDSERCTISNVCIRNHFFVIPATKISDDNAKLFSTDPDHCNVYVYSKRELNDAVTISMNTNLTTLLLVKGGYNYWTIDPGKHSLTVVNTDTNESVTTNFVCDSNQNLFFEYGEKRNMLKFRAITEKDGMRAVNNRYLLKGVVLDTGKGFYDTNYQTDITETAGDLPVPKLYEFRSTVKDQYDDSAYKQALDYIADKSEKAWEQLCIAANADDGAAQEELGFWHRTDINFPGDPPQFRSGIRRDDRIAYMWYRLAELKGIWGAKEARRYISERLTESELTEAKQFVIDWEPGQCPEPH